jgi:hypothetical protein
VTLNLKRLPFTAWVAALTVLAGLVAAGTRPGHPELVVGVVLGMGVAGGFAAVAVAMLRKVKNRPGSGIEVTTNLARAFAGLMLARMVGYLTLVLAVVALKILDPMSVCIGLACGTLIFQVIEVIYLRKMT